MSEKKDVLMDHDYDGIRELDNDLPPWWLYLFYITIIYAVLYMAYYHVFDIGDSSYAEYMKDMNPGWTETKVESEGLLKTYHSPFYGKGKDLTPRLRAELMAARSSATPTDYPIEAGSALGEISFEDLIQAAMLKADEANLQKLQQTFPEIWAALEKGEPAGAGAAATPAEAPSASFTALSDEASLSAGKNIFLTNCITCHGKMGEGGIGPNLTDDYWIHGAGINNVMHTIINGVPAKGMIAWGKILNEEQMLQVASYILTLHGTNPPNGKAPQGEKVEYPLK